MMQAVVLLAAAALPVGDLEVHPGQSIQAAIDAAQNGDRVLVHPGSYVEAIDFKGKAIEVIGLAGPLATSIDVRTLAEAGYYGPAVAMNRWEGPDSKLQGFTVQGAKNFQSQVWGGGVSCYHWAYGGATNPTITDCIIRENSCGNFGGGVGGDATLIRCVIVDNFCSVADGGGVGGSPVMKHCIVARNVASDGGGGGVAVLKNGTLSDCVIVDNVSWQTAQGGGVFLAGPLISPGLGAVALIERCVIAGNYSDGYVFGYDGKGGGIYATSESKVHIDRCTIVDNAASSWWGYAISGVSASGGKITNTIIRDNVPPQGQVAGFELSVTWSNVQGGMPGTGNFDADPLFVEPGQRDYHLRSASPCVDAGDPLVLDPDGTIADVGAHAFQTLYTAWSTLAADWETPSWPEISLTAGGHQDLVIAHGDAHAGEIHVTLGSLSGTAPGTPILGQVLPLNVDAYLLFTASGAPPLQGSVGILNDAGMGKTSFALPAGFDPVFAGITAWHAALILDVGAGIATAVTNAEPIQLLP